MAFDVTRLAGSKLYVCATAQTTELDATAFAGLTWVQIGKVGKFPESGIETNVVTYDLVESNVSVKGKGISKSKDWTIEVARSMSDAGQDILRTAGAPTNRSNYAVRMDRVDGSKIYNIGIVTGPTNSGGGGDDPDTQTFVVGTNMADVVVDPS